MKEILTTHASILRDIPQLISEKFDVRSDTIKLINVSTLDESRMTFQLSFKHTSSDSVNEIVLNFELRESSPHMLYFETLSGLKGYERSNDYGTLEIEIVKFIAIKIDQ